MDKFRVGNTEIGVFDGIVRVLIILLPFTTLISVFGSQKLGIPGLTYYKEFLLIIGLLYIGWKHVRGQLRIQLSWIDIFLGVYILYLVGVSLGTTGIRGIVYGGRYDFEFLLMFWLMYHGGTLLEKPLSYYLKLFLISCGTMLFVSGLLKFPLSEDLLLYAGYSGNPSAWQFGNVPPIFHGIDGANVRRFQGILDGPNTMGAFLIMFSGIFAYYIRNKRSWFFVNGLVLFVLFIMVLYTYSRSAILGTLAAYGIIVLGGLGFLFRHYKKQFIGIMILGTLVLGMLFIQYSGTAGAIIGRAGSTQGHIERMKISIERFTSHPLGQGLGSSGPGYRYTQNLEGMDRKTIEEKDSFYIPESWYLQQLVEGGVIGIIAFLGLMILILVKLFRKHIILGAMFVGVGVMNLFLHTLESAPFSLLFFLLIGIILSGKPHGKHIYEK